MFAFDFSAAYLYALKGLIVALAVVLLISGLDDLIIDGARVLAAAHLAKALHQP